MLSALQPIVMGHSTHRTDCLQKRTQKKKRSQDEPSPGLDVRAPPNKRYYPKIRVLTAGSHDTEEHTPYC